jgi:ABC-type multidrug transport system fused ATPase/permease subunit
MHAVGHALVALVVGALAGALAAQSAHWPALAHVPPGRSVPCLAQDWACARLAGQAFWWSLAGVAVFIVKGITGVYATYVQGRVAGEVGVSLRLDLLDGLLAIHRLRRPRHGDQGAGGPGATARGVAALTEHVHEVELGLRQGVFGGARAVAQLLPLGALLVVLSARTAALAGLALVGLGAVLRRARSGYRVAAARGGRERAGLIEAADESVRHAELWVSYGAEAKARSRLRALGEAIARRGAALDARAAALSAGNEVLGAAALAGAIGAGFIAKWAQSHAILSRAVSTIPDGATLLAFAVAFFLAYRPLRDLTEARLALARASAAYGELSHMIVSEERVEGDASLQPDLRGAAAAPWQPAPLELLSLRLVHGSCSPLTLRVEPGSIVAIVGATGVGKTTLLRTLLGLERAAGGELLFGGVPIGDAPAGPVGRPFAWVPQEAPLLAGTLDANIALGAATASASPAAPATPVGSALATHDVLEPIGAAHLTEALEGARLGAGGRAVSGGERQWIALARAIATRQPVLLLDEPTSGLDSEAQRRVLEAVASLRGRRTVLLVTHRPEPLSVADVIVRLEAPDPTSPIDRAA